jgi:hypothetical protein
MQEQEEDWEECIFLLSVSLKTLLVILFFYVA